MVGAWIVLSTKWDFANVQATLNVIISVLGTIGLWAFSRVWWQRGSSKVIRRDNVPLSSLFTFGTPGEAWDVLMLLKSHVFSPRHLPLLVQLLFILTVTAATILAGPIARYALRSGQVIQQRAIEGLAAGAGSRRVGNRVSTQVLWNDTIQNLDLANFPRTQLLDFVPPRSLNWVYQHAEWDSTWTAQCVETSETALNITANSNYTIVDPLNAFPEFGDTVDTSLLNQTAYRQAADFCGWVGSTEVVLQDIVMYVLIQSNPSLDDQMDLNQEPLHVQLSALRIHDGSLTQNATVFSGRNSWRLEGVIPNASYTRVECTYSRKSQILSESLIPWPWTNDTGAIVSAFADYSRAEIASASSNSRPISIMSPNELLRFYQVYVATMSTATEIPVIHTLSIVFETVELSVVFLTVVLLLVLVTAVCSIRYWIFSLRHKTPLEELFVPDAKLEWMIHAVKHSKSMTEADLRLPDRDHFETATFGRNPEVPENRLGSVYTMSSMTPGKGRHLSGVIGKPGDRKEAEVFVRDSPFTTDLLMQEKKPANSLNDSLEVAPNEKIASDATGSSVSKQGPNTSPDIASDERTKALLATSDAQDVDRA